MPRETIPPPPQSSRESARKLQAARAHVRTALYTLKAARLVKSDPPPPMVPHDNEEPSSR